MTNEAELEYLRFFYEEAQGWLKRGANPYINEEYKKETGKEVPKGYRGD